MFIHHGHLSILPIAFLIKINYVQYAVYSHGAIIYTMLYMINDLDW